MSGIPADIVIEDQRHALVYYASEIERLQRLLRDIRADEQTAHWHEDINATLATVDMVPFDIRTGEPITASQLPNTRLDSPLREQIGRDMRTTDQPTVSLRDFEDLSGGPYRPCTCHPDDNPPRPCPQKYALAECRATPDKSSPG